AVRRRVVAISRRESLVLLVRVYQLFPRCVRLVGRDPPVFRARRAARPKRVLVLVSRSRRGDLRSARATLARRSGTPAQRERHGPPVSRRLGALDVARRGGG